MTTPHNPPIFLAGVPAPNYPLTMTKKIIVAIDGLSSCGKSTMARQLAEAVGYAYIDTGAMYRAVTLYALRHGLLTPDGQIDAPTLEQRLNNIDIAFRVSPETGRSETYLNGENVESAIRGMEVSAQVSRISSLPFVRRALGAQQQAMGREKGLVMDGREVNSSQSRPCEPRCRSRSLRGRFPVRRVPSG